MYKQFFKRVLDFVLAVFGFILLFPIFLVIWTILLFVNNGKPFFLQPRPGKDGKVFSIIKFKSMTDKKDEKGQLLPNNLRVTKFGSFLRKSSLDEIPQLLSIIKGDMSLVGPRPLRIHYLPYYTTREKKRHEVRPGITGLAQVSGRNALAWDERLEMDVKYVENLTFATDIKILFLTSARLFNTDNQVTNTELRPLDYYREPQSFT